MPEKCVVFGCSNVRSKEKGILLHPIPFYGKSESEKQKRRKKYNSSHSSSTRGSSAYASCVSSSSLAAKLEFGEPSTSSS